MSKEVFLNCRTLTFTQDLEKIWKNQNAPNKKVLSTKFRFVKKDNGLWAWVKHLLGMETTRRKDVAKALVQFSKKNYTLFDGKNSDLKRNLYKAIIAKVLNLKLDEKNEVLKNENSEKNVKRYEKYLRRTELLNVKVEQPKVNPNPDPTPQAPSSSAGQENSLSSTTQQPQVEETHEKNAASIPSEGQEENKKVSYSLEDVRAFVKSISKSIDGKDIDPKTLLKTVHAQKDWGKHFNDMLDSCPFDSSEKSFRILSDINYIGGLLENEEEIKTFYQKISQLDLPADQKESLYVDQLEALVVNNKPKIFETIISKTVKPEYEVLWQKVVEEGLTEIAAILIEKGKKEWEYDCRIEKKVEKRTNTPLHKLARRGTHEKSIEIGEMILAKWPDLIEKKLEHSGNTPLIDAGEKLNQVVYDWLLKKDADPKELNKEGQNASTSLIKAKRGTGDRSKSGEIKRRSHVSKSNRSLGG